MTAQVMITLAAVCLAVGTPQEKRDEFAKQAIYEIRKTSFNPYVTFGIYENMEIIYRCGDEIVTLSAEDVVDWVRYWPDGHWDIDDDKIADFVEGLQERFDTWNVSKILHTTMGETISVPAGEYGWRLDRGTEVKEISKMLRRNGVTVHDLHFSTKAAVSGDKYRDYGDSYIEIDLTRQCLWMYEEGDLVLVSDIVSGLMNTSRQTPGGAYGLYYKQSPAVLTGADYTTPVSYWMPFNGGIGLHDATWQPGFGGDACYYRGSHGCINLPLEIADAIYQRVYKGYPVLCYY